MLPPESNSQLNYFQILQHAVVAFVCAFAKESNDSVYNKDSILEFIVDFFLSGICGSLIGLIAIAYVQNIYISLFIAGVGAFLGPRWLELIAKSILSKYSGMNIEELPPPPRPTPRKNRKRRK